MPSWVVQGDGGTVTIGKGQRMTIVQGTPPRPDDPTRYSTMRSEGNVTTEETIAGHVYGDQHEIYREIAAALRGEQPFAVQPQDALELSRILDAIRTSNAEKRVVTL
jgi:predicted dehydrogenase